MEADRASSSLGYYEACASEYDQLYAGRGVASIPDREAYIAEVDVMRAIASRMISGDVLDLACGTAFWLPSYAAGAQRLTLVDQSEAMLAIASDRTRSLGVEARTHMVRGDALTLDLGTSAFDSIIVAFLLSHLTPQQQSGLIGSLARALRRGGRLLILDSAWSEARARVRSRVSEQERVVADGRSFRLHKRYFTGDELSDLAIRRGLTPRGEHAGDVFLAVSMSAGG